MSTATTSNRTPNAATTTGTGLTSGTPRLSEIAKTLAEHPEEWLHRVRLNAEGRWYERLDLDDDLEVWLISWLPGQSTGFHDHGDSHGAFAVALGCLEEHEVARARQVPAGATRGFGSGYVHDVRNSSAAPAVSLHVYSPPLRIMHRYDLTEEGLVTLAVERAGDW